MAVDGDDGHFFIDLDPDPPPARGTTWLGVGEEYLAGELSVSCDTARRGVWESRALIGAEDLLLPEGLRKFGLFGSRLLLLARKSKT